MDQGLIGLIGMTGVLLALICISLFSGRTLGGLGFATIIDRKDEPDLFRATIAIEVMMLAVLLFFSVAGTAEYLGHPLI